MKNIGFIGGYDKTDLIIYIAKVLVSLGNKVLVIDSTVNQKAKYVVPVIKPTTSYVTDFEGIDVAVGFDSKEEIKSYLGTPQNNELDYDIALIDIDKTESVQSYKILEAERNYFVTAFDTYSLKRGLEILSGLTQILKLTRVFFSSEASQEEEDYLNYLSLGYKIEWEEEKIYFPINIEDQNTIAENERVSKIKFKKLSNQYKEAMIFMVEEILGGEQYSEIKKVLKQLEKGV